MKILRQTTTAYPTPQFIMGKTTAITSHINNIFNWDVIEKILLYHNFTPFIHNS